MRSVESKNLRGVSTKRREATAAAEAAASAIRTVGQMKDTSRAGVRDNVVT